MEIEVLYEDRDIIVVLKPQGVPSQEDKTGDEDMLLLLRRYLNQKGESEPYVGLIHRLDRPVGGVMVFAGNQKAAALLSKAVHENKVQKTYYAVACGQPPKECGQLRDYLLKNGRTNLSAVVPQGTKSAREAILDYQLLEKTEDGEYGALSLLKIRLKTGRHHQIRTQLSHHGLPLWGDTKYNPAFAKVRGRVQIALWSGGLHFRHPSDGREMDFVCMPREYPFSLFKSIGFLNKLY